MNKEEFEQLVRSEEVRDWRYWFTYLSSGFLLSQLFLFFFQVSSLWLIVAITLLCFWICLKLTNNHYENVIAHEIGYNRNDEEEP